MQERARLLDGLIERERSRLESLAQGNASAAMPLLDLCSGSALSEAAGLPLPSILGAPAHCPGSRRQVGRGTFLHVPVARP